MPFRRALLCRRLLGNPTSYDVLGVTILMAHLTKLSWVGVAAVALGVGTAPMAQAGESLRAQARSPQRLAQVDFCRQVFPGIGGLNVRESPALSADVVTVLPAGSNVTLDNLGEGGWVPISAPVEGYVSSRYLRNCAPTAQAVPAVGGPTPEATCQAVIVSSGLNVRAQPTLFSNRLPALPTGTEVAVSGPVVNNWVPIEEPVVGYVAERFLGPC
jgi:hypothetical protein